MTEKQNLNDLLEDVKDNEDGLFIVAYVTEKKTPKDPNSDFELIESWGVAHGLADAKDQLFHAQSLCNYFAGGIFVCIESDVYPTLGEQL